MGSKIPQKETNYPPGATAQGEKIAVTPRQAFRMLSIGEKLGYRLIREKIIPTCKLSDRRFLVPVDELRRMMSAMVKVDRSCRTCVKKDARGKCAAFASPPRDVQACPAWTLDPDWNLKLWRDTARYERQKD